MGGKCIDRYYIEKFIDIDKESIRGRVAEIGSDESTAQFGGGRVESCDMLDINEQNGKRTIAIDLTQTASAPEGIFDRIHRTRALFEIYDYSAAVRSPCKMLKPKGVLLATVPGIGQSILGGMLRARERTDGVSPRALPGAFVLIFSMKRTGRSTRMEMCLPQLHSCTD